MKPRTKQVVQVQNRTRIVFPDVEDIIENIVEKLFLAETSGRNKCASTKFVRLALVSRKFLNPVRRNLYADLRIGDPEHFLMLAGQLRVSPHLARFVKHAWLYSGCSGRAHFDEYWRRDPLRVTSHAMKCFLDACPLLEGLDIDGGDYLGALSSLGIVRSPCVARLKSLGLHWCSSCASTKCISYLDQGWLDDILAFPGLKTLDMTGYRIDGLLSEQAQASGPRTTVSSVSFLRIDNQYKLISPSDLIALLRRLPVLQRLVLANMMPMRPGEFKECLDVVAPTLTSFSLNDDRPDDHRLRSWEDDAVSGLVHLKELEFGGVPVTPALFDMLPPGLERLAFFGNAMKFLPTPEIATWLRRDPFPLRGSLKRFDFGGEFWTNTFLGGPEALAYLGRLCDGLNIEWKHTGYKVEEEDDDILLLL